MAQTSAEKVWNATDHELLDLLEAGALVSKPLKVSFYAPSFMHYQTSHYCSRPNRFFTVSVTGKSCALNCSHCGGKLLGTMYPAETPEALFALCTKLKQKGASGCLISGGCLPDGSVPLQKFIPVLGEIKRELGLTVVVHTGIVDFATAKALTDAGVDAALIDIIGSDATIKDVADLNVRVEDYADSLEALHRVGISFVPHVIVGLDKGELRGEFRALNLIRRYDPSALVVIAFLPVYGTVMASVEPPRPVDVARVVACARLVFPEKPVALGCMRPKGEHRVETDVLCLKAGANAIAFPSEEAVEYAKSRGYEFSFSSDCCSQVFLTRKC